MFSTLRSVATQRGRGIVTAHARSLSPHDSELLKAATSIQKLHRASLVSTSDGYGQNPSGGHVLTTERGTNLTSSRDILVDVNKDKDPDEGILVMTYMDGHSTSLSAYWLRDACKCEACLHPATQTKLSHSGEMTADKATPQEMSIIQTTKERNGSDAAKLSLEIIWRDGHSSTYDAQWLRAAGEAFEGNTATLSDGLYAPPTINRPEIEWDAAFINRELVKIHYDELMSSDKALREFTRQLVIFGIARLRGVPAERGRILNVARRLAYERQTGYGVTFDVTFDPDPQTHLSYTGARFEHHVDLAYRERSPGVQMLHCIQDAAAGEGKSFFADGFRVASELSARDPNAFDLLATYRVPFCFLDSQRGRWYRASWPVIGLGRKLCGGYSERVEEIHYAGFSLRAPVGVPTGHLKAFYRALDTFTQILRAPHLQYETHLSPGDLVAFNNRRVLHGRGEYDPTRYRRFLQGCYVDLDEVVSLHEWFNSRK